MVDSATLYSRARLRGRGAGHAADAGLRSGGGRTAGRAGCASSRSSTGSRRPSTSRRRRASRGGCTSWSRPAASSSSRTAARCGAFLDIRDRVRSGGEQGLLSVAFHPKYAQNHRFYVDYTDLDGDTRVVEYRSDGTQAIPGSARQLLHIDQPYPNHNGGQLAFGPNGLLYVGMGDGGAGGDPENRAQNPRSLLGKLLTLNVDVKSPRRASRRSARATRGASPSTGRTATSTRATSARAPTRRSTTGRARSSGSSRTTGGTRSRAGPDTSPRSSARGSSSSPSTSTATAGATAPSPAASSTAARPCPPRAGATSSATTAAGSSGASRSRAAVRPRSGASRSRSRACPRSARTRAASSTSSHRAGRSTASPARPRPTSCQVSTGPLPLTSTSPRGGTRSRPARAPTSLS